MWTLRLTPAFLALVTSCNAWQAAPGDQVDTLAQMPQTVGPQPCQVENPPPLLDDGTRCGPAFSSGVNVAWLTFAGDVPRPALCKFQSLFTDSAMAGGPVIRWWLHTNGAVTPGYDSDGFARPITQSAINAVRAILDVAEASHVMLTISLWSFDMLKSGPIDNNVLLLTDDAHRQRYIDNVLVPLAAAVKGHRALYAWEAFNEAEGMTTELHGWTPRKISEIDVQRSVNWFGSAVHTVDPLARFTTGCWSFPACSSVGGFKNYYSDAELQRVGGKTNGTLDFYEVHYYTHNGQESSPFVHPASYWNLDKPIVIGEFVAADTDGVARDNLFTHLSDTGYAGAWAWQYANEDSSANTDKPIDNRWPSMQKGIENLRDAQPAKLDILCE